MTSEISSLQILQWARGTQADSDPTSFVRNQEFNAAVGPLAAASHAAAQLINADGSLTITNNGQIFTLAVKAMSSASVAAGQGLLGLDPMNGLFVVLGTGTNQAAAGNHTHPEATEETDGFMAAADKAKLDGMLTATEIVGSVLATVGAALQNTATITALFAGEEISFNVVLAEEFAAMEGQIINAQAGGLAVQLGTGANVAAAGNHTHPGATEETPGFMSAADKSTFDAIPAVYAPISSPELTGIPKAPTASLGTNSVQLATTAFVVAAINALVGGTPGALDTLKELADALGDDANFAADMANALALKAPLASPNFSGMPTAPTPGAGDASTALATTAFVTGAVAAAVYPLATSAAISAAVAPLATSAALAAAIAPLASTAALNTGLALKATLASPAFTGTPTAPTPAAGDSSEALATTAFVGEALSAGLLLPFVDADGDAEPIALVQGMLTFFNADGSAAPISLI